MLDSSTSSLPYLTAFLFGVGFKGKLKEKKLIF